MSVMFLEVSVVLEFFRPGMEIAGNARIKNA
jgi:hypothetical protein